MTPIVLVGAGGHCRSCIDVIESTNQFSIKGIVGQEGERGSDLLGYSVEYVDADLPVLVEKHKNFLITVGQIKSSAVREKLYTTILELGGNFPKVVSPFAYVASTANIGEGTIVMHMAVVNANVCVGENCIVNTRSLIEHDSNVGHHCHISTSATLNGGVRVGDGSFVGSGAVTLQGIEIPANTVIGAASWVDGKSAPSRRRR